MNILTVSQINFYIRSLIDSDKKLCNFYISGEISNFKGHYKSGHLYFSLKDNKSVIRCIMFSNFSSSLKFRPIDGLKVLIRGGISVYEATGQYQIYVEDMQPAGIGELSFAFEQLKEKLSKEGLFDLNHKKPLPKYPGTIGLITSPIGAAVKDVQNTLSRRFPLAKVLIYPVLVQGNDAAFQMIKAIESFSEQKCVDVIIIARGGGSIEDLWAFNNEDLARTIYDCDIPIVSGVGHQTDFTICDLTADMRAPTPTAAAELCTPDESQILAEIRLFMERADYAINLKINKSISEVNILDEKIFNLSPDSKILNGKLMLEILSDKLDSVIKDKISKKKYLLGNCISKLESLNPLAVLKRGYLIAENKSGRLVKSISDVKVKQKIKIITSDGFIECEVINVEGRYDE